MSLLLRGKKSPVYKLTALIHSLNGHIFVPGLETYADQSALNPAASALDSQVGYVGSAATQGLGENFVKNSEMVGASVGVLPTNWTTSGLTAVGITAAIDGAGIDATGTYIQISLSGTASGNGTIFIFPNGASASSDNPSAYAGQLWSARIKVKGVSGTQRPMAVVVREISGTSFGSFSTSGSQNPVNNVVVVFKVSRRCSDAATDKVGMYFQFSIGTGQVWNNTVRIYAPQLERGYPTNYTPTYGTAVSRGVFASAAQGTLANTPKLVTLGNARGLEFDGLTDHLVTDITTPSSGYMLSVFRQTARTTESAMMGSIINAGQGKGFYFYTDASGYLQFRRSNGVTTVASISPNPVPLGQLMIADCAFNPALADVRINGTAAGTNTQTADPGGGTAITLIGASNNVSAGGITPFYYFPGAIGITIIIPNVTLPTSTEQRIRKLVGQIYGVQTQ